MEFRAIIDLAKKRTRHAVKEQRINCIETTQRDGFPPHNRITYGVTPDYNDAKSATTLEYMHGNKQFCHRDQRINYSSECMLEVQGTRYFGLLENISTTGASIEMSGVSPKDIQYGGVCTLTTLLLSRVKYSCTILRVDSNQIALQFINPSMS